MASASQPPGSGPIPLYLAGLDADMGRMEAPVRQVHVIVTWQSEHVVEIGEEDGLDNLAQLLQAQSNAKLVSYTARPLEKAVDDAIDELLDR